MSTNLYKIQRGLLAVQFHLPADLSPTGEAKTIDCNDFSEIIAAVQKITGWNQTEMAIEYRVNPITIRNWIKGANKNPHGIKDHYKRSIDFLTERGWVTNLFTVKSSVEDL